jgi:threonine aldolase
MANQVALRTHSSPGATLLAEERTHVMVYEMGGPAIHSGLVMHGIASESGRVTPAHIRGVHELGEGGVVVLENTHRSSGGSVWPLDEFRASADAAHERGAKVHLDGARLFNAAVAAGLEPRVWAEHADSVTICFSKGLGCPVGAVVAGSHAFVERAWESKYLFGGAMRQAGVVAAAGVYALDHHVARLADDHARARRLAEALADARVPVDLEQVETNFVQIDAARLGLDRADALARLSEAGVGLSATIHPSVMRAVTHLDVTDDDIARASELIPEALGLS